MFVLHYFVRVLYFDTLSVHLLQMKVYKSYNFSIVFYYYSIEWYLQALSLFDWFHRCSLWTRFLSLLCESMLSRSQLYQQYDWSTWQEGWVWIVSQWIWGRWPEMCRYVLLSLYHVGKISVVILLSGWGYFYRKNIFFYGGKLFRWIN